MPDSGRGRLTPSKRKFLRAAAILQLARMRILSVLASAALGSQAQNNVSTAYVWNQ
jgi:hypothetical protein